MAEFERVIGHKSEPLDSADLERRRAEVTRVLIDIGAGDGCYVLDQARAHPDWLCIALDAVADNMTEASRRGATRPEKGGTPNAMFIRASAESLPGPLRGLASDLTINYPWGSLLRTVVTPEVTTLRRISAVCRPNANVHILINFSVFADSDYLARLELPSLSRLEVDERLAAGYTQAGLRILERRLIDGEPPYRTTWGRRLVRGSHRATLIIRAIAEDPDAQ